MAKIVTCNRLNDKTDRSLVEYLYGKQKELGDWVMVKSNGTVPVMIPEVSNWLLLVVSPKVVTDAPKTIKRIAAIPMENPFKIMLFDGSEETYTTIWAWVNDFKSDKTVIIEIQ
jgi:hypothetical protein